MDGLPGILDEYILCMVRELGCMCKVQEWGGDLGIYIRKKELEWRWGATKMVLLEIRLGCRIFLSRVQLIWTS